VLRRAVYATSWEGTVVVHANANGWIDVDVAKPGADPPSPDAPPADAPTTDGPADSDGASSAAGATTTVSTTAQIAPIPWKAPPAPAAAPAR